MLMQLQDRAGEIEVPSEPVSANPYLSSQEMSSDETEEIHALFAMLDRR